MEVLITAIKSGDAKTAELVRVRLPACGVKNVGKELIKRLMEDLNNGNN